MKSKASLTFEDYVYIKQSKGTYNALGGLFNVGESAIKKICSGVSSPTREMKYLALTPEEIALIIKKHVIVKIERAVMAEFPRKKVLTLKQIIKNNPACLPFERMHEIYRGAK